MGRPPRSEQFDPDHICIVHTVQRCVRRAYLAGEDSVTGKDFGFRREWIRRRIESLASVFAMDVLNYTVLSNHMHLVLRNRPDVTATWSDREVAVRWLRVYPGRRIDEQLAEPTETDIETLVRDEKKLAKVRRRLSDISWFMKALSEPIARRANRQDERTGHFWEGRFKAQPINDEAGLLACAMYVDLNPVRAAMAETPDQSKFTSAYDRIAGEAGAEIESAAFDLVAITSEQAGEEIKNTPADELKHKRRRKQRNPTGKRIRPDDWLAPIQLSPEALAGDAQPSVSGVRASDKGFLGVSQEEYLSLLRWTAQQRDEGSGREVPEELKPLLNRLGFDSSMWRDLVWNFKHYFGGSSCVGSPASLAQFASDKGRHWIRGQKTIAKCFAD